jgi:hypothetical protein
MSIGRKKGYKVSQEVRDKTSKSYPVKTRVETPHGVFDSIREAGRTLNLTLSIIRYKCHIGELQRNGQHTHSARTGKELEDCTGWKLGDSNHKATRMVRTPSGEFVSVHEASRAMGISASLLLQRLKNPDKSEYDYID